MQSYVKILVYDGWLLILACKHLDIITTTQHHHIASFWLRFLHPSVDLARDGEREKRTDGQTDREKTLFKRRIWNSPFFSFFKYVTFFRYRYRHIRWRNACNNEKCFSCSFNVICDDGSSKGGGWRGDVDMHIHR